MAASQSVSLRVPQRLLEHIDTIAVERFPTRKNGEPNRSRVILDFIEKGIDTVSDNIAPQRQTSSDNIEELIRQQVQFQLQIQQMVRQQLEQYSPSFPTITELQLEVAEIKRILTVNSPPTVSDNSSTHPEQPTTASTQPQPATQRQSDRSGPEQSQPATASMQPEPATQRQAEPVVGDRHQLSDNRDAISNGDDLPEQSKPAATSTPERDRTELSDSLPDIALQQSEPPSHPSQFQPPEPASEQQADRIPPEQLDLVSAETHAQQKFQPQSTAPQRSDLNHPSPTAENDRTPPEQPHSTTAETQAQSALQPESAAPEQSDRDRPSPTDESDRIPPEQLDSATAETQAQQDFQPQSTAQKQPDRNQTNTVLQPVYDPYAYTPPERDYVSPGQPPQKPGNRIVKIDTADDLLAEIRWCLSDGGHFILCRSFVPPQKIGYFLEHRAYSDGERQVKTALAKELIKRGAIRSDDPTKGSGSGHREFYIWDDRDFAPTKPSTQLSDVPPDRVIQSPESESKTELQAESDRTPPEQTHSTTAETLAQQEFQPQQSDSLSRDLHLIATEDQSDRPEPATALQQSDKPAPEFPEWMTAKQAFQALGGDPGDRDSSVASIDGLKQIKFSTFKKKSSSELKPFGLELSQDRKRRRLPCYRLLKLIPESKSWHSSL